MTEQQPPERRVRYVPMVSGSTFIALASIRNTETQLRWQGAQLAIALNLSAFAALSYRVFADPTSVEIFTLTVSCAVVTFLNIEWRHVLRRDGKLLEFWNKKIKEHESANRIEGGVEVFTSSEYQKLAAPGGRLQLTLERLSAWFISAWTLGAVVLCIMWMLALKKGAA